MAETASSISSARPARIRALVVPREHGAWGLLLVPLFTGAAVGLVSTRQVLPLILLALAVLALFWLRTPVESLLGTTPLRAGTPAERRISFLVSVVLAVVSAGCLTALLWNGHNRDLLQTWRHRSTGLRCSDLPYETWSQAAHDRADGGGNRPHMRRASSLLRCHGTSGCARLGVVGGQLDFRGQPDSFRAIEHPCRPRRQFRREVRPGPSIFSGTNRAAPDSGSCLELATDASSGYARFSSRAGSRVLLVLPRTPSAAGQESRVVGNEAGSSFRNSVGRRRHSLVSALRPSRA